MAWCWNGNKPSLNQSTLVFNWMSRNKQSEIWIKRPNFSYKKKHLKCRLHNILFKPQCLYRLWPSGVIWWHKSRSTLAQLMACCLMAPSHYLNQCWPIINEFRGIHYKPISQKVLEISIPNMSLKNTLTKLLPHLAGPNELMYSIKWYLLDSLCYWILEGDSKQWYLSIGFVVFLLNKSWSNKNTASLNSLWPSDAIL